MYKKSSASGMLFRLLFAWNVAHKVFEELEVKLSIVIHSNQATHPLLN